MLSTTSEIRVALLGNVSAGKTTVLNALFKDKYGEVSMKRTTAAVNYFRICAPPLSSSPAKKESNVKGAEDDKESEDDKETINKEEAKTEKEEEPIKPPWFAHGDEPRTAQSTLKEITEDNETLRECKDVKEKWFDIELSENLVEMRKDTQLVLVDIPGINEAGACSKYKDYVNEKWETFDCVVLVMDGKQGVNTEDQVYLLKLVQANLIKNRKVPVIVLFNKVDDPNDKEQAELVCEARAEVEKMFAHYGSEASRAKKPIPPSETKSGFETTTLEGGNATFDKCGFGETNQKGMNFASGGSPFASGGLLFGAPSPAPARGRGGRSGGRGGRGGGRQGGRERGSGRDNAFGSATLVPPTAFGSIKPFSIGSSAFGSSLTPAFGSATPAPPTAFGTTSFGSPSSFGAPSTPAFGSSQTPSPPGGSHESTTFSPPSGDEAMLSRASNVLSPAAPTPASKIPHPAFIPVSAMNAFIHQSASTMTFEQFRQFFDKELLEKVGRYQLGQRRWNKLSEEDRTKETFEILSDPLVQSEALQDTSFDKFLTVLNEYIGGEKAQHRLIEGQIQASLQALKLEKYLNNGARASALAHHIEVALTKTQVCLGLDAAKRIAPGLKTSFWAAYSNLENEAVERLKVYGPDQIQGLAVAMQELVSIHKLSTKLGWDGLTHIESKMRTLFRKQLDLLLKQRREDHNETDCVWDLPVFTWHQIWGSILLIPSISKHFCLVFGREKLILDMEYAKAQRDWLDRTKGFEYAPEGKFLPGVVCPQCGINCNTACDNTRSCQKCRIHFYEGLCPTQCRYCNSIIKDKLCANTSRNNLQGGMCSFPYQDVCGNIANEKALEFKFSDKTGKLEPVFPDRYAKLVRIRTPDSPSSPYHFGHIAYMYCRYMQP